MLTLALKAGNDMCMICHRVELAEKAKNHLSTLPNELLHDAILNIEKAKKKLIPPDQFTKEKFLKLDKAIWQLRVNTLGEKKASEKSIEDGKRSPVELY